MINLFCYWEGPMPRWIEVCIDSMRRLSGYDIHLVTPENVGDYLARAVVPKNLAQLQWPSHRSDYYRAALLYFYGGWYWDADTVGLKNPPVGTVCPACGGDGRMTASDYLRQPEEIDFVTRIIQDDMGSCPVCAGTGILEVSYDKLVYSVWDAPPRRVIGGYLYSPKGHPLTAKWWYQSAKRITDTPPDRILWNGLVETILTPMLDGDNSTQVPRQWFMPVDIETHPRVLPADGDPDDHIKPESICFGLHHSMLMNEHRDLMASDERTWADSKCLALKLLSRYL